MTALLDHMKVLESQGLLPKAPGGEAAVTEKKIEQIQAFDSLDEYAQKNPVQPGSSDASKSPEMEEKKIEPIQEFESLEDYAAKNPPAESPTENLMNFTSDPPSDPIPEETPQQGESLPGLLSDTSSTEEPLVPTENVEVSFTENEPQALEPSPEEPLLPPQDSSGEAETSVSLSETDALVNESSAPLSMPIETETAPLSPADDSTPTLTVSTRTPLPPKETPMARRSIPDASILEKPLKLQASDVLRNARTTSEGLQTVPVEEPLPFTVRIEGILKPDERGRLLQLLESEKFPLDLKNTEMQLDAGRVLIPRISEYAAVAVVRCLRSSSAVVTLAPSEDPEWSSSTSAPQTQWIPAESSHPADALPVVTYDLRVEDWQGRWPHARLDTLMVSLVLVSQAVEVEASEEYQEALERLKQELRYRAHFKQAYAVGNLRETLSEFPHRPLHYRLSLSATLVLPPPLEPQE